MKVDIKTLIGSLDTTVKHDIEQTAQRCLSRGGSEILIEDKLFVMLERKESLLLALLAHYDIATETMVEALQKGVKSQSSESTTPVFSKRLVRWLEDAYFIARLDLNMDELTETAGELSRIASSHGIQLAACAEESDLEHLGITSYYTGKAVEITELHFQANQVRYIVKGAYDTR